MAKHVLSLTYKPKIEAVKAGLCGQTVRLLGDELELTMLKHAGDEILLHTWASVPYRSKWDWRGRYVLSEVMELYYLDFWRWSPFDMGHGISDGLEPVDEDILLDVVQRDHIDPPTIEWWESVLMHLNGLDGLDDTCWEVLRWPCVSNPDYVPPTPPRTLESYEPRVIA